GLVLLDHLGDARSLVDVGSGAGLPGLPIKIVRPELGVTLIEADQDKAAFLAHTCAALDLDRVVIVARRAAEAGHDPTLRGRCAALCEIASWRFSSGLVCLRPGWS